MSKRGHVLSVIRVFQKHRETFLPKFRICPYGKPILLSSEGTVKVQNLMERSGFVQPEGNPLFVLPGFNKAILEEHFLRGQVMQ